MASSCFDGLSVRETSDGAEVRVRVAPQAKRSAVQGLWKDALRVQVASPPREGKANEALCVFLAGLFRVPPRNVEIRAGARSKDKVVLLRGIGEAKIRAALADLA
jgi:uncharacterized protein (TIGR00251 family)